MVDESTIRRHPAVVGTVGVPQAELPAAPLPPRAVIATTPEPGTGPGVQSLIAMQRDVLRAIYATSAGVTRESYAVELVATARAAASDGDYTAAANLYKLIGQHIGALDPSEKHVHFHGTTADGAPTHTDLRAQSDDALRALIQRAKAQQQIVDAVPAPIVDTLPAPAGD